MIQLCVEVKKRGGERKGEKSKRGEEERRAERRRAVREEHLLIHKLMRQQSYLKSSDVPIEQVGLLSVKRSTTHCYHRTDIVKCGIIFYGITV